MAMLALAFGAWLLVAARRQAAAAA
jgi:hypothetical protein